MLYDEKGRPYVEPPLIPEEQHVFNIVKDYRRMYYEYHKLKDKVERNKERLEKYEWMRKRLKAHEEAIIHCIKHMKKQGVEPSKHIKDYMEKHFILYHKE